MCGDFKVDLLSDASKITLHQGAIETILLDSMGKEGLEVDRSLAPTGLEISEDPEEISSRDSYPIKVALSFLHPTSVINLKSAGYPAGARLGHWGE